MVIEKRELQKHTPFERWVASEGLKVIQQQVIPDIRAVDLEAVGRTGCDGALLDLTPYPIEEGDVLTNDGTSRYLCDIPPGGTFRAERHMYEEMFFVVSGRGDATVWYPDSPKQTFEWQEGSVFSIPLNTWHELYNGSGDTPARLYAAFNAPTVFNLYNSEQFIFNCDSTFPERFDPYDETYFSGKSEMIKERLVRTNFVSNVRNMTLDRMQYRGPGTNMHALMADGHFVCHLSEFPGLTYKKAHTATNNRTRAGLNSEVAYLFLSEGFDLQWAPGINPGPGVPFEPDRLPCVVVADAGQRVPPALQHRGGADSLRRSAPRQPGTGGRRRPFGQPTDRVRGGGPGGLGGIRGRAAQEGLRPI